MWLSTFVSNCCVLVRINSAENSRHTFSGLQVHNCNNMAFFQIKLAFLADPKYKKLIINWSSLSVV